MVIYRTSLHSSHAKSLSFQQHIYVLWFLDIARIFSYFPLISLFISSTLFTTTKYGAFSVKKPCLWTSPRLEKRLTKPNILHKKDVKYLYNTLLIIRIFTTNLHLRHKYARNERLLYLFVSQLVTITFRKLTSICQTFKALKH